MIIIGDGRIARRGLNAAAVVLAALALGAGGVHPPGDFVAIPGAQLWVEHEGQGAGPPLVLIAGGPGLGHDYFHPFFSRRPGLGRLIYYDAAGRGRSSEGAAYSLGRDVADLEALRRALGLSSLRLFGHSYGGMVALAYALDHPAMAERVIVADTHWSGAGWQASNDACNARIRSEMPEEWERLMTLRAQGLRGSALSDVYRVPPAYYFYRPENAGRAGPALALNPAVYFAIAGADADFTLEGELARLDLRPRLRELRMPLLVLAGRHDQVVPLEETMAVKTYAPGARIVLLERSGHFPFIEETDATVRAIVDFLAREK